MVRRTALPCSPSDNDASKFLASLVLLATLGRAMKDQSLVSVRYLSRFPILDEEQINGIVYTD